MHNRNGYSLVEIMVATVLISVAIVAVFQAVSKGSEFSKRDFLYRRAYLYLEQILEDPAHSYRENYYLEGVDRSGHSAAGELKAGTHCIDTTVVLDDRDTPGDPLDDLTGQSYLTVADSTATVSIGGFATSMVDVPYKKLTASLYWTYQGQPDSAKLETIVSLVDIN